MTSRRRAVHRRKSFDEFVAEHLNRRDEEPEAADRIPEKWKEKPRRRAGREPPSFAKESEQALEWGRVHCQLWKPAIEDVKRLAEGRTGLLIRGRRGGAVTLILDRGQVEDVRKAEGFKELAEVL